MQTHNLEQGSPQWLAHRARCWNAGDAPAMLGCSPYETRQQLLHRLATGIAPEVDAATQRRFDEGHRFEALARPLAEEMIGDDLAPVVGTTDSPLFMEGGRPLGASFDGITFMGDIVFEHKTLNQDLRNSPRFEIDGTLDPTALPKHYRVQMEQQMIVSGAERVLFMATRWEGNTCAERLHCFYLGDDALRSEILAGWRQFAADLATYTPPPAVEKIVAEPVEMLPAPVVQVSGTLALQDNFVAFETRLRAFLADKLIREPKTDQDFADLDAQIKVMKDARAQLKAAEAQMLAQVQPIDQAKRTKDMLDKLLQQNVSMAEKILTDEKERRKGEIVAGAVTALREHVAGLNKRLGQPFMPATASAADFGGCIKGLRSLDSMEDKIATALANAKIAANEVADRIAVNLLALPGLVGARTGLTPDLAALVVKSAEDFAAVVSQRVTAQREQEERRAAELAERERERIRKEEEARAAEKVRQEQEAVAREQRAREDAEALERRQREAATAPAPAPIAASVQAAPAANVVPMPTKSPAAPSTPPSLKLGQISERIGWTVTADLLTRLGFPPAATDKNANLYHEADFTRMLDAMIQHLRAVQLQQRAA